MTLETGRPVDGARFVGIRMHDVYVWRSEEREVKERRLSAIPESVLRGSLRASGSEAAANVETASAGRTDMCKVQTDAENVDVSTWNRSDVYGGQTVSRNNIDISPLDQSDMCKVQSDAENMDEVPAVNQTNIYHCTVTEEIENPFSYTIMLRTAEGSESFGMELNKQKWDSARRTELDVFIPPEAVLLLQ